MALAFYVSSAYCHFPSEKLLLFHIFILLAWKLNFQILASGCLAFREKHPQLKVPTLVLTSPKGIISMLTNEICGAYNELLRRSQRQDLSGIQPARPLVLFQFSDK